MLASPRSISHFSKNFTNQFGTGSEFGFKELLQIFGLLSGYTETELKQVRDSLGLSGATPYSK